MTDDKVTCGKCTNVLSKQHGGYYCYSCKKWRWGNYQLEDDDTWRGVYGKKVER